MDIYESVWKKQTEIIYKKDFIWINYIGKIILILFFYQSTGISTSSALFNAEIYY